MSIKVIELFAGVGGFRIGLNDIKEIDENGRAIENRDWDFVWSNQYEPSTKKQHAYECYKKRFGECDNTDINKVDKIKIPDHDLLVGGFPCQDYSVARTKSNGIEGKKGVLFWDIIDVLKAKQTPYVLLENVDRLLKSPAKQRGRDFAIMLKAFNDLGYSVEWQVINAADYGFPQRRRRVFIFAHKGEVKNILSKAFPVKKKDKTTINLNYYKDIVELSDKYDKGKLERAGTMYNGIVETYDIEPLKEKTVTLKDVLKISNEYNENLENYIVEDEKLDRWKYLRSSKRIDRVSKTGKKYVYSEGAMEFPDSLDKPSRTILTSESATSRTSHIIFDPSIEKYRRLTEIETEILQGFPINWTEGMPKGKRYFMMGNALVTGIVNRLEPYLKELITLDKK